MDGLLLGMDAVMRLNGTTGPRRYSWGLYIVREGPY